MKGYRFEHNFGHGQQFLSSLSRKRLFGDMKALTTYLCFDSREHLPDFMLEGWSYQPKNPIVRPPKPEIG